MELSINNEIKNNKKESTEVTDFINELGTALENNRELKVNSNLYNEILKDVELAPKYRNRLQSVINKCLKDMSYERDFYYFDFNKRTNKYFLDYYNDGERKRFDLTKEGLKEFKKNKITFYEPIDEDKMVESDTLKDWMKCEVSSSLLDLEIKNRES